MGVTFFDFMQRYIELNIIEKSIIKSKMKEKTFKKGELIHRVGDICKNLLFIEEGYARAYVIDENGKDYTWSLIFNSEKSKVENLFLFDYYSFIKQEPSSIEIEALSDVRAVSFTKDDCELLFELNHKLEKFARLMSEEGYSFIHKLIIDRQTKSAKRRFEEFMQTSSHLLDIVPQYHIASYLDITPQHLSRLKRKINLC
jgi:CRP-like cAMP-binding protein